MPRVRGLDRPWTNDQMISWVLYPGFTAGFFVLCSVFYTSRLLIPLAVNAGLVIIGMCCWLYIELTDPGKPGGIPCWCMRETQKRVRFSAADQKRIMGLDHHCTWLNTAIGKRNYL